jgi:hypothetical protein
VKSIEIGWEGADMISVAQDVSKFPAFLKKKKKF